MGFKPSHHWPRDTIANVRRSQFKRVPSWDSRCGPPDLEPARATNQEISSCLPARLRYASGHATSGNSGGHAQLCRSAGFAGRAGVRSGQPRLDLERGWTGRRCRGSERGRRAAKQSRRRAGGSRAPARRRLIGWRFRWRIADPGVRRPFEKSASGIWSSVSLHHRGWRRGRQRRIGASTSGFKTDQHYRAIDRGRMCSIARTRRRIGLDDFSLHALVHGRD